MDLRQPSGSRLFLDNSVIDFLMSTVNGTQFEFLIGTGSSFQPVRVEHIQEEETNVIKIYTPNREGVYHQTSIIVMDSKAIANDDSVLFPTNFIMWPYADPKLWENNDKETNVQ